MDKQGLNEPEDLVAEIEALGETLGRAREMVARRIIGHALLIGLPGLGKTPLVETLGTVMGLDDGRIQFTPDLMPADILGSEVLEEGADGARSFRFLPGPVFCQLLLADESNRASPRTQLLWASSSCGVGVFCSSFMIVTTGETPRIGNLAQ